MKKIKNKYTLWLMVVALILVVALMPLPAAAGTEVNEWYRLPVPEAGDDGDWVLTGDFGAGPSGVTAIDVAYDGTVYAAVEAVSDDQFDGYNLFRSPDGGYTWKPLWTIPADDGGSRIITVLLPWPDDSDIIYLATENNVYRSTNGGTKFSSLGSPADEADQLVSSIAVADYHGDDIVYVGIRDTTAAEFGGLFFRNEGELGQSWVDVRVGNVAAGAGFDVVAVLVSPDFEEDQQVVAVATDEVNSYVTAKYGNVDWGVDVGDAVIPGVAATGGAITIPANYDSDVAEGLYTQYVGLEDEVLYTGGLYIIGGLAAPDNSLAIPLLPGVPVCSVDAAGEAFPLDVTIGDDLDEEALSLAYTPAAVVAGLATGGVISITSGLAYTPPGTANTTDTCVAIGQFQSTAYTYTVYAGTSGYGGGFARSVDSGANFARTGLMCEEVAAVEGLAVSPVYDNDDTLFLITRRSSGQTMLWRTNDRGDSWEAVLSEGQLISDTDGDTGLVSRLGEVKLSPRFSADTAVFILETGTEPDIWRSEDSGTRFWTLKTPATTEEVDVWAVDGLKEILVGDDTGDFFRSTNSGLTWQVTATGAGGFRDLELSPDYDADETILAVGDNGSIWLSTENGREWNKQPDFGDAGDRALLGAFSPDYAGSGVIYAAGVTDGGRLIVEQLSEDDSLWRDISPDGLTGDTGATGLGLGNDGTLYVTDGGVPGLVRSLNDGSEANPYWEVLAEGINGAALEWLAVTGDNSVCWGLGSDDRIWIYQDILTGAVTLSAPKDGESADRVNQADLSWEAMDGARQYEVEYDIDAGFKNNPQSEFSQLDNRVIYGLEDGLTYYWHVRAVENEHGEEMRSRWSATWSFTTDLESGEWNPFIGGVPEVPTNGTDGVSLQPTFAWNAAGWATGYEFVLARDAGFTDVVISRTGDEALATTVYLCEELLEFSTTYYWQVRAIGPASGSEWATAIFTTEAEVTAAPPTELVTETPVAKAATPAYVWVVIVAGGALVVAIIILIFRSRRE
jgi:hypothetical protein